MLPKLSCYLVPYSVKAVIKNKKMKKVLNIKMNRYLQCTYLRFIALVLFLTLLCGCAKPQNNLNSIQQLGVNNVSVLGKEESIIIGAIQNRGQFYPEESAFWGAGSNYMIYVPDDKAKSLFYHIFHAERFNLPGVISCHDTYSINYFLRAKAGEYYFSSLFQGREAFPLGYTCIIPEGELVYLGLFDLDHYGNGRFFRKNWVVQKDKHNLKNMVELFKNLYPDLYAKIKTPVVVGHCFAKEAE